MMKTLAFVVGAVAGVTAAMAVTGSRVASLRRKACVDSLTGVPNRAGLHAAWPAFAPTASVVALVDLDGFKPVNDTYGHAAGDVVLTTIAARLRTRVAGVAGGLVARLGGDEFALVLPGSMRHAYTVAVLAAAEVALSIPVADDHRVTVTASIGLAPSDGDLAAALAAADAAMYRAKTSRSGVVVYDPTADDRTAPTSDPRPMVRVRDLPTTSVTPIPARAAAAGCVAATSRFPARG